MYGIQGVAGHVFPDVVDAGGIGIDAVGQAHGALGTTRRHGEGFYIGNCGQHGNIVPRLARPEPLMQAEEIPRFIQHGTYTVVAAPRTGDPVFQRDGAAGHQYGQAFVGPFSREIRRMAVFYENPRYGPAAPVGYPNGNADFFPLPHLNAVGRALTVQPREPDVGGAMSRHHKQQKGIDGKRHVGTVKKESGAQSCHAHEYHDRAAFPGALFFRGTTGFP
ncbi:MAG: hypothetical protein BWY09_02443 [Candidatus Hydrogenedentes bacterium ADurb.Bin179]|nr:MAG: hypothetical protein BWY09_02443 [Candidatus Hydrogenedentes bacterium ADurb.Bin179]